MFLLRHEVAGAWASHRVNLFAGAVWAAGTDLFFQVRTFEVHVNREAGAGRQADRQDEDHKAIGKVADYFLGIDNS